MKSKLVMGLVSAGRASQSFLSRLPSLQEHMGPVKANSFKSAKETAKMFKGAYKVSHYSALEMCDLIWIALPENMLDQVIQDMAAQMPVHKKMIVVCDCVRESTWPNALSKLGARMATLNAVQGTREKIFAAEGNPELVALLKRWLWSDTRQLLQMSPKSKPLLLAGFSAATRMLLPWVDSSVRLLRSAGFTRADAMKVADVLVKNKMRDYENTGAKCWGQDDAAELGRILRDDLHHLAERDPRLARLFADGVRQALDHFAPGQPASKQISVASA